MQEPEPSAAEQPKPETKQPDKPKQRWTKKRLIICGSIVAAVLVISAVAFAITNKIHNKDVIKTVTSASVANWTTEKAVAAGKQLSGNQCKGTGSSEKLSVSPMNKDDFAYIEPYGLMVGGHVTPVDHQYYYPTNFRSPKDTYPVYAMADSTLVGIEIHPTRIRLTIAVTCTYLYYYDLLTSLEPGLTEAKLPITLTAGQLIGHIGGQTLDFAVWDTTKPLQGFINPQSYKSEDWKLFTADPLNYYTDELKQLTLAKYARTAEPRSGKIDYDVDGKLIGTWFQEGTNGYGGATDGQTSGYWTGHLSIVPDHLDPTATIISVGYLAPADGNAVNQFSVPKGSPDPSTIGVDSGLVKYELRGWGYQTTDGTRWDNLTYPAGGVTLSNDTQPSKGCALVQLTGTRTLKFETMLGKDCASITSFSNPKTYTR